MSVGNWDYLPTCLGVYYNISGLRLYLYPIKNHFTEISPYTPPQERITPEYCVIGQHDQSERLWPYPSMHLMDGKPEHCKTIALKASGSSVRPFPAPWASVRPFSVPRSSVRPFSAPWSSVRPFLLHGLQLDLFLLHGLQIDLFCSMVFSKTFFCIITIWQELSVLVLWY